MVQIDAKSHATKFLDLVAKAATISEFDENNIRYEAARLAMSGAQVVVLSAAPPDETPDVWVLKGAEDVRRYLNEEIDSLDIQSFVTHDRTFGWRLYRELLRHTGIIKLVL